MDSFAEPHRAPEPVSLAAVREQVRKLEADHRANGIPLSGRIIHVCHYLPVAPALTRLPSTPALPSPPATPPAMPADIPASPTEAASPAPHQREGEGADVQPTQSDDGRSPPVAVEQPQPQPPSQPHSKWSLAVRYGHSAMISGIASLAATHEQLVVGWTGDIAVGPPPAAASTPQPASPPAADASAGKIPASAVRGDDRRGLETLLAEYRSREEIDAGGKIAYVPVWLDDTVAHGHYEGYCKQSECRVSLSGMRSLFLCFFFSFFLCFCLLCVPVCLCLSPFLCLYLPPGALYGIPSTYVHGAPGRVRALHSSPNSVNLPGCIYFLFRTPRPPDGPTVSIVYHTRVPYPHRAPSPSVLL